MSKKEMDDFIMFVFLVEQELACEIVYSDLTTCINA
jgi:hypothetical protein